MGARNVEEGRSIFWLRVLLCVGALVALCTYSAFEGPGQEVTIATALADPVEFAGMELRLPSNVRVVQVGPQELLVEQQGVQIAVRVPDSTEGEHKARQGQPQVGDYVSVRATFHPGGIS